MRIVDEAVVEKFRRIYTAVQHRDADALQEDLAHDIEWVLPESLPWGGTHHGHLGVAAMVELFIEHVDGIWADPDEMLEDGDTVVILGRVMGRGRQTGREFEVPFAHVWRLSDGVPSVLHAYYDTAPVSVALG